MPAATPSLAGLLTFEAGAAGQVSENPAPVKIEQVLLHEATPLAGDYRAVADAADGSVVISGRPAAGMNDGIYRLGATPAASQLISAQPADELGFDAQSDLLAMRFGHDAYGQVTAATLSSIAPGPGDNETVLFQQSGTFQAFAADRQGNVYFAGKTAANPTDGIYRLNTTSGAITLIKAEHADRLAIDAEGDVLSMRFGHDAYGSNIGGAVISEIDPATGEETTLYNDPTTGDFYNDLAVAPDGRLLFSGQPGAGMSDGIYRLNSTGGTLDLLSGKHADRLAVDSSGDLLAMRFGHLAYGNSAGAVAQLAEIPPATPIETILLHDATGVNGTYQDLAVAPDGGVVISGQPASGMTSGIYRLGTTPGSFQLISSQPADALGIDGQGDIFAVRFGHDAYGNNIGGAAITEYNAATNAPTVLYNDGATSDRYQDLAVDQQGNVYLAGQPGSNASDGVYRLPATPGTPVLVKAEHADRLAIDAEGDVLAMRFGHDSYGANIGGAAVSEIHPATGIETVLYNNFTGGSMFSDLAVAADGRLLLSGRPASGMTDGIYRLNATTGTLNLLSAKHADQLATDSLGDVLAMRFGHDAYGSTAAGVAQVAQIAPQAPIETVLFDDATTDQHDLVVGPDGRTVISGQPSAAFSPGIYRLGTTPGSYQLISSQPADELAVDSEGDVLAMRFGHDFYGNAGGAAIVEYQATTNAPSILYNDPALADKYQDLAVDQQGNVYFAGQPSPTAADGVYRLGTTPGSYTLVKAEHADRLAIDAEGDLLAMRFGHDSYGNNIGGAAISQIDPGTGAETPLYNDTAAGDFYQDLAAGADGRVLFAGQPGAGMTDGVYALNPTSGELDLVRAAHADRIASLSLGVIGQGGYTVTATPGLASTPQTVATFTDPYGALPPSDYTAEITWGDQTASAGSIAFDAATGVFSIQGSHTYASLSSLPITVAIGRTGAPSTTLASTATALEPATSPAGNEVFGFSSGGDLVGKDDQRAIETVLLQETTPGAGDFRSLAVAPDGSVLISGKPGPGMTDGIYRLGTTPGSFQLISSQPADRLRVDAQGDILAMRFGHDSYGESDASQVSVSSIAPGGGDAETVLFQDAVTGGGTYQDIAVDKNGNVYLAGQPASGASDGIYRLGPAVNSLTLIKAEHADRLAVDAEGDVLAMRFGHDAYGNYAGGAAISQINSATGVEAIIYNDPFSGDFYQDFALAPDGRILLSGQAELGATDGIYRLNATTGRVDLISRQHADLLAADAAGDILAMRFGHEAYGASTGSVAQVAEIAPAPPIQTILLEESSPGAGAYQDVAAAPDGGVVISGSPAAGVAAGIYRLQTAPGSFQLISKQPADHLAVDADGDILAMRFGHDSYGNTATSQVTVSSIAPGGGDVETILFQDNTSGGGTYQDIAVDRSGNVYLAGQPGAGSADGIYRIGAASGALTLIKADHADRLAIDAAGDILAMRFGHDAYGNHSGGAAISDINPATGAEAALYNDPSNFYNGLAVAADGRVVLSRADGVFRFNATAGTLDILADVDAVQIAANAEGGILDLQYGRYGEEQVAEIAPRPPIETVLLPSAGQDSQSQPSLAIGPDGRVVISGQPLASLTAGIYRLGSTPGSYQLISDQPADALAIDAEGDILAMRFGHDVYGNHIGGAAIVEYNPATGAQTTLYNDPARGDMYEDLAVDQQGNVYLAGKPGATSADGIYRLGTTPGSLSLIKAEHTDRLAIDAAGDLLAMRFGHDVYGNQVGGAAISQLDPATGTETLLYNDFDSGDYYFDVAAGSNGSVLFTGQPGEGTSYGLYALNRASGELALISPSITSNIAEAATGVAATEGVTLSAAVATFAPDNPSLPQSSYSAVIDWGDNSALSTVSGSAMTAAGFGTLAVPGKHLYSEAGTYTLSVSITGADESRVVKSVGTVEDAPLTATATPFVAQAGAGASATVASFTDANPAATESDYSATIAWGDGTATAGTVSSSGGGFRVSGSHTYASTGTNSVIVSIRDRDGATITVTGLATVSPTVVAGVPVSAVEDVAFSGPVATFVDHFGSASAPYSGTATINWGDGQSDTISVTAAFGATATVAGAHRYAEEGAYSLSTVVKGSFGDVTTYTGTATVTEAPLSATGGSLSGTAGSSVSGVVATFIHGQGDEPAGDFAANIDWGDGDTSAGSVTESSGTYSVSASHTYDSSGTFTVKTTISEEGASSVASGSADITPTTNIQGAFGLAEDIYVIGTGTISVPATDGVLKNDSAPSQLTVASGTVAGANGGSFAFNADGSFTYTPPAKFTGFDYAQYTAKDVQGDQNSATVYVISQPGGVVWKFYEQVLNRDPDYGGLQYWINDFTGGGKTGDIAVGFFESDELLNSILGGYYQQYLGRTLDPAGLAYWKGVWHATGGPEGIKAGFAASAEFNANAGNTTAGWLTALYNRILNRTPDPQGLQYWQQQLAAGMSQYNVALGFFKSLEAYQNDVTGWFQEYLGRAPTASELDQYAHEMAGGKTDRDIEQQITNLPEYGSHPPASDAGTGTALPNYRPSANTQSSLAAKDSLFTSLGSS